MGMVVVADVVLVLCGVDVRGANLPGSELEKPKKEGARAGVAGLCTANPCQQLARAGCCAVLDSLLL